MSFKNDCSVQQKSFSHLDLRLLFNLDHNNVLLSLLEHVILFSLYVLFHLLIIFNNAFLLKHVNEFSLFGAHIFFLESFLSICFFFCFHYIYKRKN